MALLSACPTAGLDLEEVNSASGVLVARPANTQAADNRVLIKLSEQPSGQTTVGLELKGQSLAAGRQQFDRLFNLTSTALAKGK